MTMEKSNKHEPQVNFQAAAMETHPVSDLLVESGNCRQIVNFHLLSDSLFSEQQKLRHVLDWVHSFLSSGSDVHHELCRADSLILAKAELKKSLMYMHSPAAQYLHPVSCAAGGNEAFVPFSDDPCISFSFTPEKEEYREIPENRKSMEPQDPTNKQTSSQDNNCRTSSLFTSNDRQHNNLSDRNMNQTDGATGSIKEFTSCWSDVENKLRTAGAQSERHISGHQMALSKVEVEGEVRTKKEAAKEELQDARRGKRKGKIKMENSSNHTFNCHQKIPPALTIYERYQLCVAQLHCLREKQGQLIEPGCFIESPAEERNTSEEAAPQNPVIKKHPNKAGNKSVKAAEIIKKRSPGVVNKKQDRSQCSRSRATPTEHGQTKHCDNPTLKETPVTSNTHLDLSNKCSELTKRPSGDVSSTIDTPMENISAAPGAALITNPGLFPERIRRKPGVKSCQSGVKGQKAKAGGQGALLRLCDKSGVSLFSPTNEEILQRPQSSGVNKHTKRHTPEDKVKPSSACRYTHKYLPPTETHTPLHDDLKPTLPPLDACPCKQTNKYRPAGVPVSGRWLCLPDEVWLSILSLLSLSDLSSVLQVCSRLNTLATDHTLWRNVRVGNANLTEQWLLCVGRRRPHSLCLYSCSGPSLTSSGLEMFFTLCKDFLEELKVTSCTGPGLHGDQMLPLIGQLCHYVTSVDVSWSGATDTGVKALSDCCPGLRLKSVVLNGCHVTDDPLMKLVMRHKESLCRLEVFGCQFLTPSCLQTVYKMCPGLQHLNIGQVPKVNAHSLTVMTSQLKCVISLNLTGLQAVSDAIVDTLLQNCVELQSLTFSSCPGVTDLSLNSIRKYTPCIRSLNVSGCKAVTDAGVQSLALGCRRLQQLDLSSTGAGNRGATLLANYCSGHLHTVKLSICHITSENILKICRRCKRLKILHLYGCAHLPTERQIREVNTTVKVYSLTLA